MLLFLFGWLLAIHVGPMSRDWLRQNDAELSKRKIT